MFKKVELTTQRLRLPGYLKNKQKKYDDDEENDGACYDQQRLAAQRF